MNKPEVSPTFQLYSELFNQQLFGNLNKAPKARGAFGILEKLKSSFFGTYLALTWSKLLWEGVTVLPG